MLLQRMRRERFDRATVQMLVVAPPIVSEVLHFLNGAVAPPNMQ